jgi:hypothetical protein
MINFIHWCQSKSLPLPASTETTAENTKRAGVSQEYPDGYVGSQYPDAYFAPIVATSYLDIKNRKGNNRKAAK